MKAVIEHGKASAILHDGKFYDTNKEIDLPFSVAYKLKRNANVKAEFGQGTYDPELWKKDRFVNFWGDVQTVSGFGGVSYNLIKFSGVKHAVVGVPYQIKNDQKIVWSLSRELQQNGAMVWHDQPRENWLYSPFARNIAITPFETTRVPRSWVGKLNMFDALFVPCKQNIQMMRDSGVQIPIELIHWGVDTDIFKPIERPAKDVFTFGHMGALSVRKGTDMLIDAFREAFPREQDVELICKTSFNTYPFMVSDPRIKVHLSEWDFNDMMTMFFKKIDCFVFPTRGEGFGLTPLEAMATGVPAIVTGWSGPMEYMNPEVGWTIDHTLAPAKNFTDIVYKENCGEWAEPKKEHLIELMRHAYKNRDEVKAKGAAAAAYVAKEWPWSGKIKMYEDALAKHL